jgi:drug/metabolite transporter (DMT)-like permease
MIPEPILRFMEVVRLLLYPVAALGVFMLPVYFRHTPPAMWKATTVLSVLLLGQAVTSVARALQLAELANLMLNVVNPLVLAAVVGVIWTVLLTHRRLE